MLRVVKHWSSLPRTPPSLEMHSQIGQGSEQPGLVEDVSVHCKDVRLGDL